MKILSAEDTRLWDQYTMQQEPVASIDLMERAASRCVDWLLQQYPTPSSFGIFCGKGNNGGDGLAIARMLMEKEYVVTIYILEFGHKGTDDFQTNLARLHEFPRPDIHFIQSEQNFHTVPAGQVIIDALFGSGLNRELEGVTAHLVEHINNAGNAVVSVDVPSGLFTDRSSKGNPTIKARYTLSFQCYKPAFLFPENEEAVGEIQLLDIGLHPGFYQSLLEDTTKNRYELVDKALIRSVYRSRKKFAHKGDYGHALLVAGSYGKTGAAILAAKACLRSGVGLLTTHIPQSSYAILQSSVPESMVFADPAPDFLTRMAEDITKYAALGIGPGIGMAEETKKLLQEIIKSYDKPVVLDADALNIIAGNKELFGLLPAGSILTPHPKEFERLFGKAANDFDRALLALEKAKELRCVIIVKGHHSFIATAAGKGFFNSTGNPGMATAGSGDVLTGILTGLLAQGYGAIEASILGVYLHGLAGGLAAGELSMESMIAGDIIENLGKAFLQIREPF